MDHQTRSRCAPSAGLLLRPEHRIPRVGPADRAGVGYQAQESAVPRSTRDESPSKAARVESGDDLTTLSPIGAMAKLHGRPVFITHGTADTRLSVTHASDLATAIRAGGGTVDPWIVPGSEHVNAIITHPAEYEQRLVGFFDAAIGTPPGD